LQAKGHINQQKRRKIDKKRGNGGGNPVAAVGIGDELMRTRKHVKGSGKRAGKIGDA